jgi:hypothetical protein
MVASATNIEIMYYLLFDYWHKTKSHRSQEKGKVLATKSNFPLHVCIGIEVV